jgi:hypothetical protein
MRPSIDGDYESGLAYRLGCGIWKEITTTLPLREDEVGRLARKIVRANEDRVTPDSVIREMAQPLVDVALAAVRNLRDEDLCPVFQPSPKKHAPHAKK